MLFLLIVMRFILCSEVTSKLKCSSFLGGFDPFKATVVCASREIELGSLLSWGIYGTRNFPGFGPLSLHRHIKLPVLFFLKIIGLNDYFPVFVYQINLETVLFANMHVFSQVCIALS